MKELTSTAGSDTPRIVTISVAVASLIALFIRRPDAFLKPQFYAEDGVIFFAQAHESCIGSLVEPYAGYLCLFPRVVGVLTCKLPVLAAPAAFIFFATAALLATTLLCLSPRIQLPLWQRVLMALALSFSPTLDEVLHSVTNAQWTFALGLLLMVIITPPRNLRQWAFDLGLLAFVGLTGPFLIIFSPLYVVRVVARRTRYDFATLAVVLATGVVQSLALSVDRAQGEAQWFSREVLRAVIRLFAQTFAAWSDKPVASAAGPVFIVSALCVVAVFGLAYEARRARDVPALVFLAGAAAAFVAALYAYRAAPIVIATSANRYLYIPTVALIWVIICLGRRHPRISSILLIFALAGFLRVHREDPFIDYDWPAAAACIDSGQRCVVRINPEGWAFTVGPTSR